MYFSFLSQESLILVFFAYSIKMFKKQNFFFTVICVMLCFSLLSQTEYLVGHIGLKDGLSSQLCSHVLEDDHGNLWISTYQDIQKYNGYSVAVFPQKNKNGKKNENIADLFKDANGYVWVVQAETKFNHSNFNSNSFYSNFSVDIIDATTDSVYQLNHFVDEDEFGELDILKIFSRGSDLFLCTIENKIYKYNQTLELYATLGDIKKLVTISESGEIYVLSSMGLCIIDQSQELHLIIPMDIVKNYDKLIPSSLGEIFMTKEQDESILISEFQDSEIEYIASIEKKLFSNSEEIYKRFERYGDNLFLVWNRLFELEDDGISKEIKLAKTTRLISDYFESETGLSYATTDLGVYILKVDGNRFNKMAVDNANQNSVRAFYTDSNLSLFKDGDEKIKMNSSKYSIENLDNYDLGFLAHQHYKDPINENHIWTVGLLNGCFVRKMDLEKGVVDCINMEPDLNYTPSQILRSSESNIMYISTEGRPFYFDEGSEKFKLLDMDCLGERSVLTTHLLERNEEIWFASADGIIQYNELTKKCKINKIFPASESYVIQFMHEDKLNDDIIWIGSRRGGLVKWNTKTDSIQIFNIENGLSNNDVHAIVEDNYERLWIPTNNNLNLFDKRTNEFFHFTETDGISHSEFNKYSYFYDSELNQVYFGGLNGYTYFNPDSVNTSFNNNVKLTICAVTKIDNDGKTEDVYLETFRTNWINMLEKDVSIQIELFDNYILHQNETKYSYRIPGLLDDWKTSATNVISLNRLPYGEYKIEFIADMNRFSSMSDILVLNLNVERPWWKAIGFILSLLFGIIFLIWQIVLRYNRGIVKRNLKLEEMVSLRTKELQQVVNTKNKIFTILAHDLRNPLSGLTDLSNKIKFLLNKNRYADLDLIALETEKRVKALDDNLNNILIWAMSENDTLNIQPRLLSVKGELEKVLQLYAHEIENKDLEIQGSCETEDMVFVDLTILQTLLRNFMHNAIKFSIEGGKIELSCVKNIDNLLELKIEDFGIGMVTPGKVDTSNSNAEARHKGKGAGIGIKIAKELAAKGNVGLRIDSELGSGTSILLTFPKAELI